MKRLGQGRYRLNIIIRIVILLGFASFFLKTIITNDVTLYVHPRTVPVIIIAGGVMIIIAFLLLGQLFRPAQGKEKSWTLVIWTLPLFLAFAFPAHSLGADASAVGEVQLSGGSAVFDAGNTGVTSQGTQKDGLSSALAESEEPTAQEEVTAQASDDNGLLQPEDMLVMDSNNFYRCIMEICDNLDKYIGTPIEVTGFVFREVNSVKDDQFVPARMLMTCCAADLMPVGLLCCYEGTGALSEGDWVKVTGTIEEVEYKGSKIPCILADSVEGTRAPEDSYIYPY